MARPLSVIVDSSKVLAAFDELKSTMQLCRQTISESEVDCELSVINPPTKASANDPSSVIQRNELNLVKAELQGAEGLAHALTHFTLLTNQNRRYVLRFLGLARVPDDLIPVIQQLSDAKDRFAAAIDETFPVANEGQAGRMRRQRWFDREIGSDVDRTLLRRKPIIFDELPPALAAYWLENPITHDKMTEAKLIELFDKIPIPKDTTVSEVRRRHQPYLDQALSAIKQGHTVVQRFIGSAAAPMVHYRTHGDIKTARSFALPVIVPRSIMSDTDYEHYRKKLNLSDLSVTPADQYAAKRHKSEKKRTELGRLNLYILEK
jgi:hypothetical protein